MENVDFPASGEEIERALMDLGPLLGVTVKEEAPDELTELAAPSASGTNVGSATTGVAAAMDGSAGVKGDGGSGGGGGEGADSLASPGAARTPVLALRCVLCQTALAHADGTPKLMECLHSVCEPCVKLKIEEKQATNRDFLGAERVTVTCPACRLQCQPSNMIDQRFVLEKVAAEQVGNSGSGGEQQCNSCEDPEPATSYCVDCAEFICDNCVHAHQRLKITKEHTIKCKEEAVLERQALLAAAAAPGLACREHPGERLALFCETCDRLTCRDCQLHHHRDHKYQFSTEMAAQARAHIASLLSEVSYKRVLLGSAMKVIRDRQQLIADKKKALVHDITQTVVKLTNAINTRGKQLVLRLNEVCDGKQRTLAEKKDALEQLAAITDHCVAFVNQALEQGSDTAVLYSKRVVCAHLQRIKCRRADIPNPEIPVRIQLALDKLPDLVKVLSTIGAIVVDGKVDGAGGAGGAQGPYHPPAQPAAPAASAPAPAPPHAAAAPPHSAVVALQHVAMQQSYVQSRSGASPVGSVGGAPPGYLSALQQQMRARPAALLRQPHVTSTTHPHHLHGINELNLRGLLNSGAQRVVAPPAPRHPALPALPALPAHPAHPAQQAMHHAYQQMMGAYGSNVYGGGAGGGVASGRRSGGPRTPSPAPPAAAPPVAVSVAHFASQAKWHIPQQSMANGGFDMNAGSGVGVAGGNDFKITLGRQQSAARPAPSAPAQPAVVTSTNPKTPSPSLNGCGSGVGSSGGGGSGSGGGVSSELDKMCEESVQDLLATIAKLDSNGVQVLRERASPPHPHPLPSPAPHVHSSTDDQTGMAIDEGRKSGLAGGAVAATGTGDPNEDWCAVCMDGGELMCCDKCPKVFHQYCHIPTIEKLPDETETWQCLLCVNFAELPPEDSGAVGGEGLSPRQRKLVERITLELYCQYEPSLPFREPVPAENLHYHSKISRPMCLDMVRMKLQPGSAAQYTHVAQFVSDCRLLFRNAYHYNPPDSQIYKDAKRLEEFFDAQLLKWVPEYAYWGGEGEPPAKRSRPD